MSYLFLLVVCNTYADEEMFLDAKEAFQANIIIEDSNILVSWKIAPDYYLYRHAFKAYAATADEQELLSFTLPEGVISYDTYLDKEIETYSHDITQRITYTAPGEAHKLILYAQGCSKKGLCYPPEKYEFDLPRTTVQKSVSSLTENNSENAANLSLYTVMIMMASGFLGGLILNLMPCVFPVLSLKVLSLSTNHQDGKSQKRHGQVYTLGVVLSFIAIASTIFIARQLGEHVGWGFQLQHPSFVISMIYLFFIMGIILMGFVEIGGSYAGLGQSLVSGESTRASFFTGVLAVLVASPCSAPFMAPALGYALTQPFLYSLTIFIALGFGMAFPFLLLSYVPGLTKYLPSPGNWMVLFKQLLAFPLFITVVWLIWVLSNQVGVDTVVMVLFGLLGISFSLWLYRIAQHSAHFPHRNTLIKGMSLTVLSLSLFFTLAPKNDALAMELTQDNHRELFSLEKLEALRNTNQAVFVDVTAEWCITCQVNEKIAFTDRVKDAFKLHEVEFLVADWTNANPEIEQLLRENGRSGAPLYLLYSKNKVSPEILPQILTEATVLEALKRAQL
ncbi:protein-disulfide reductase DsbD [Teredinibacter sp. KSP-S5-2]|uniref:protein-disulfide reductase DsbD family protein n=1 Tax=Teredinibacter sp. KSP-S5-2 TaxID=3034506 RepID=UPI0029346F0D|nr:protein-disulfide reductase DsbD [Teredinibacter sp. KSP-S5-2]WNO10814.1 protein-disulfide reductase DsbD [Teredinibacter sp. KSP-S5-2]